MSKSKLALELSLCLCAAAAQAATFTWNGGGTDANWQTAANWIGGAKPASDGTATLAFSGGTRTSAANNYPADTVFAAINFLNDRSSGKTANFALSGNRITLGGNITTTVPTVDGTVSDTISLPVLLNGNRTVTVNLSGKKIHNLTISGVIAETGGTWGLTKSGGADLTLSGPNTYSGATIVTAGRLYFNSIKNIGGGASALGAPTTTEDGTINASGRISYTGGSAATDRPLALTGGLQFDNTGSATLTLDGEITGASALTFRGNGNFAVNGRIALGAVRVARTDKGTVYLNNAANVFTGELGISDGVISSASIADSGEACAIGLGANINLGQNGIYLTTGTFQFTGPAGGACNRTIKILSGDGSAGGKIENAVAGQTLTLSGQIIVDSGASKPAPLWLAGVGDGVLSGSIDSTIRLVKTDSGTWTLASASANPASVTVSGGTLLVNSSIPPDSAVSVETGATFGGTGTVNSVVAVAAGGVIAPGAGGVGTLTLADTGSATLKLNGGSLTCDVTGDGQADRLTVAGTLVLNGANVITLQMPDGSAPAGTYVLATYAGLSGDGTLVLDRTYPNATLDVGATSATLTITGDGTTPYLVWQGDGTANLWDTVTDNWEPGLFGDGMAVVFDDTGSDAPAIDVAPAGVSAAWITVDSANQNFTFTGGNIACTGSLTKNGAGILTLNNTTAFGGAVGLNGGSLTVNGSLDSAGLVVAAGTVLTQDVTAAISGAGAGLTVAGAATLLGTSTFTGTTTVNTAGSLVLGGVLDGSSIEVATNAFFVQSAGSMLAGTNVTVTVLSSAALGGSNAYDGATTFGVLGTPNLAYTVNHNHALGSTAGGTRIYGGDGLLMSRLYLGKGITVMGEHLTLSGDNSYRSALAYNQTDGTGTWAGDIACIGAAYIESASGGGTLAIGVDDSTLVTNGASCSVNMRGNGVIALNSRINVGTGNSLNRNDNGTLVINSTDNVWGSTSLAEGTILLNAPDGLSKTTTLGIGKSDKKSRCLFDLNGHDQTVAAIRDTHYAGPNDHTGTQRIVSATPAVLTISGSQPYAWGLEGSAIEGAISLVQEGTGSLTLTGTNSYSGATVVSNGTLAVSATGTLGTNTLEVVVGGSGTLRLSTSEGIADAAVVRMPPFGVSTATIQLDAGVEETVGWLLYGDVFKSVGTYGATGSGAEHIDNTHFSGSGRLRVLSAKSGLILSIK